MPRPAFKFQLLLGILAALLQIAPQSAMGGTRCEAAFGLTDNFLQTMNRSLTKSLEDSAAYTKSLEISSNGIQPLEFLGRGFSGSVFKVRKHGREYALKLFGKDRVSRQEHDGIVIQKYLSELGMAPQVEGILSGAEVTKLIKKNRTYFETNSSIRNTSDIEMGLLMELTSSENLKATWFENKKRYVPPHVKDRLVDQSLHYVTILEKLSINPKDPDAVINDRGDLMLIDISFFNRNQAEANHEIEQLIRMVDESLSNNPKFNASPENKKATPSDSNPWWNNFHGQYPLAE